jgi:2-octaprenyl-6-methoxyphenol hydroxylase
MTQGDERIDILIAGGGFAGLSLAIALRQGLGASAAIMVADPALGKGHGGDERASAIVAAARRLFETLGVWQSAAGEAQPILDMVVTDSKVEDAVRPVFLTFAGDVEPGEPFAHMIENRFLLDALETKAREISIALRPTAVAHFIPPPDRGRPNAQRSGGGQFSEQNPSPVRMQRGPPPG